MEASVFFLDSPAAAAEVEVGVDDGEVEEGKRMEVLGQTQIKLPAAAAAVVVVVVVVVELMID
jgi:hypothetical protein